MISLILAIDRNNLIGKNGALPWHYPDDLKFFKQITINKKIIMGEETFKSILHYNNNKPLKDRETIICSLNDYHFEGTYTTTNLLKYLDDHQDEDILICGGKTIYTLSLPFAKRIYLTFIDQDHDGDTYLSLDLSPFKLIKEEIKGVLHFRYYEKK